MQINDVKKACLINEIDEEMWEMLIWWVSIGGKVEVVCK